MVLGMDGVITVGGGRVRGVWREDLWSFSGIPYARAPEGPLRWRPPQPPLPWEGVRDASSFGPIAPQIVAAGGIASPSDPDAGDVRSEDCLTLNVWTREIPENPTSTPERGRPVMVWIHGGGFTSGSGSVFLYRGDHLVRNGDVVVVTINYRLGALGFLGHRALDDPEGYIGNWGLHDQIAALRWVRDHIAQFGGDPGNVTLFGESAGGFSVAALMGAPSSAGLFHRAIVQSGGVHVHSVDEAERVADRLAAALGVAACTREALEPIPFAELSGGDRGDRAAPTRSRLDPAAVSSGCRRRLLPAAPARGGGTGRGGGHRPAHRHEPRRVGTFRPRTARTVGAR